jgi:sortase A
MKKFKKLIAISLGLTGTGIFAFTLMPIFMFDVATSTVAQNYLSPVPEDSYLEPTEDSIDYTKASNWFEGDLPEFQLSNVRFYSLTIPKLRISDATVAVGGEDLNDHLIQYPGTALPGKIGNAVIFGHSILPQYYNPENYISIFSTLPTMRKGDDVEVSYDGINYKYVVEDVFEVAPTDLEILAQNKSDSYLTLVTCTPPGDPRRPRRLIVRAKLVPFDS